MIEDKLDHDERVRLECLAQAVATVASIGRQTSPSPEGVLDCAAKYEAFVLVGNTDEDDNALGREGGSSDL